jgi:quercetin dioxygenase-like cupin family protein
MSGLASQVLPNEDSLYAGPWNRRPVGSALRAVGSGLLMTRFDHFKSTGPARPTVQHDDADIKVTRWDFAPGATTGWHRHTWPYFVVMLTDALMLVDDGANVKEFHRASGDTYNRPAGVEHDVMNGSATRMTFVEIEVKRAQALKFLGT